MPTEMPTGAKAVAAISFAVVGWITANAYVPNMPEAETVGYFREFTAFLGALAGWRVMGTSVGKGYVRAVGSGWKTAIVMVFLALLLFGIYEMLQKSVKMHYEGPLDATLDVLMRMLDRSRPMLSVGVILALGLGGGLAGLLSENASRRWR
jgi:hypothetical protein